MTRRAVLRVLQRLAGPTLEVDRAAQFWAAPRGDPDGLVYVALGDSVAQGLGASSPGRGYVGLLAERIGAPVLVVNLSVSGARVRDVLTGQVPRLRALARVDLVTLDIGGNDVRDLDDAAFATDVGALLDALPPRTVVADLPYFMHGHWEADALRAGQVLTAAAVARGLTVVPLHAALQRRGWSGMFRDYARDFFHPNDRGHRVWAEAFWPSVRDALPER